MSLQSITEETTGQVAGSYEYVLEFTRTNGPAIQEPAMQFDWGPALECARLQRVRTESGSTSIARWDEEIHPIWHGEKGEPYLGGFRVSLPRDPVPEGEDAGRCMDSCTDHGTVDFPLEYLEAQIEEYVSQLRTAGKLTEAESVTYTICAFSTEDESSEALTESGEPAVSRYRFREGTLQDWKDRYTAEGEIVEGHIPAFLPRSVVEEVRELATAAGDLETGGIFIGHLRRDPSCSEIFCEVTAQIPFQETVADESSLKLTADTWTQARAAIRLRGEKESVLGWWHSHPVHKWCGKCPDAKRAICPIAGPFFSTQDRSLHRAVFFRAESLAMVVNQIRPSESTVSMFGWRRGVIAPRGFYYMDGMDGEEQRS